MRAILNNKLLTLVNMAVGGFFLLTLAIKGGYNYTIFLLMLLGLGYWGYAYFSKKQSWQISADEKRLIFSYLFYFAVFLLSFLIHDGRTRELDNPSRIIFMLPLLLLFTQYPVRFQVLTACIPIGAVIAGMVALYDRFYLQAKEAYSPRIMHIQGGDIAMSFGMFALVIGFYYLAKKQPKPTALCVIAALFGILGSILSTARGGWIGVPFILLFVLWCYRHALSKTVLIVVCTVISLTVATAIAIPDTKLMARLNAAEHDITAYLEKNNGSTSVGARFDMWKSALLMAQEKPILGWGENGVQEKQQAQHKAGLISKYAAQFTHMHNQFLDDLSKRGIIGLIALLAVFFIPLRFFLKHSKSCIAEGKALAVLGAVHVISVLFYCLSQGFFAHNSGNMFYFFLTIVFYAAVKISTDPKPVTE